VEQPDEAFGLANVLKGKAYYRRQCNKCKKAREWQRVLAIEDWMRNFKKTLRCSSCDFADSRALAFHHLEKKGKECNVSEMSRLGHGIASIQREMAKCIVLCFNCHAIRHFEERLVGRQLAHSESPVSNFAPAKCAVLLGTTKVCRYCKVEQDESCFEICKVIDNKAYRRHKCRSCKQATQVRRRRKLCEWVASLKKTLSCTTCGFKDLRALEFHHLDSEEKDFAIGQMLADNRSIAAVKREIAKCVALCSNCHRIEHCEQYARIQCLEPLFPG
jgi:hypothetical protein